MRNRQGTQADEIKRRREDGVVRARDDADGVGSTTASVDAALRASAEAFADALVDDEVVPVVDDTETPEADDTDDTDDGEAKFRPFTAVLAVLGKPTDDGRMLAEDMALDFRPMPLPLLWQRQSSEGHVGSYTVGVIETATVDGVNVTATGYMLDTDEADEAVTQIEHGVTGPSIDLGDATWILVDADTGNEVDYDTLWDNPDMRVVEVVTAGKILGATLVSIPAFSETSITIGEPAPPTPEQEEVVASLVASVAERFEEPSYPAAFFTDPEFSGPTLPHLTADGRVQGHLATFGTCHVGIQDRCVMAPRSATDYAWFHTSPPALTDAGTRVKVGRLTVGGGHAGPRAGVGQTIAHYDDAGTCFALVHVGEDEHGIWFSGVPAPGASPDQIAAGLAAPLSGDWRSVGGNLELVAALAVNTPGFPVLAASGATGAHDEPLSLVAAIGPCREKDSDPNMSEAKMRAFARALLDEMRADDRRTTAARALIGKMETTTGGTRRESALSLIAKVKG